MDPVNWVHACLWNARRCFTCTRLLQQRVVDSLGLLLSSSHDTQREEPQARSKNSKHSAGLPARLMRIKGGIAQSKHAAVITEGLGSGILTATAVLLGKTDLSGACGHCICTTYAGRSSDAPAT